MLMISSSASYSESNTFDLREIYVSDGVVTYVLRKDEGFIPLPYNASLLEIREMLKGLMFSNSEFGPIRTYNDDDALSLAKYFQQKISKTNLNAKGAEKTLYDVLASFGEEYA